MVKAFCEDCQSAQEAEATDKPVGPNGTARLWRLKPHPRRSDTEPEPGVIAVIELCDGSGKLV